MHFSILSTLHNDSCQSARHFLYPRVQDLGLVQEVISPGVQYPNSAIRKSYQKIHRVLVTTGLYIGTGSQGFFASPAGWKFPRLVLHVQVLVYAPVVILCVGQTDELVCLVQVEVPLGSEYFERYDGFAEIVAAAFHEVPD